MEVMSIEAPRCEGHSKATMANRNESFPEAAHAANVLKWVAGTRTPMPDAASRRENHLINGHPNGLGQVAYRLQRSR